MKFKGKVLACLLALGIMLLPCASLAVDSAQWRISQETTYPVTIEGEDLVITVATGTDTNTSDGASISTAVAGDFILNAVYVVADGACTAVLNISLNSTDGSSYDTPILTDSDGWTNAVFLAEAGGLWVESGSEITVTCSAADTDAVFVTFVYQTK